jgi:hypothetical protein
MPTIPIPADTNLEVPGRITTGELEDTGTGPHGTANFLNNKRKADASYNPIYGRSVQLAGADIVSRTELVHIATQPGTIKSFKCQCTINPNGGDKQFTVDLYKTVGVSSGTVLAAVITFSDSDNTAWTIKSATIVDADYDAGDSFFIEYATSGSTGTQGQGAIAQAIFHEPGDS